MLNREEYRKFINPTQPLVNTSAYATIERAAGPTVWRAVCVYHLPEHINNRQLIAFCDILDRAGNWADASGLEIAYTWQGRNVSTSLVRPFEKKPPEPRAQVDLYRGQVTTVWVDDPFFPSDKVVGIHSSVEEGQAGNTRFHNSFIVFWQLLTDNTVVIPPDGPTDPPPGDELAALRAENALLRAAITNALAALGTVGAA